MNRQDASARLEALLARVIARKDAPRAPRAPAAIATAPTKAAQSPIEEPLDDDDSAPEVSLHPPLAGDPGQGPEIDLFERTMDLDVSSLSVRDAHNTMEVLDHLDDGRFAILANPCDMGLLWSIAGTGGQIPPRSLVFLPRLCCGLVSMPLHGW